MSDYLPIAPPSAHFRTDPHLLYNEMDFRKPFSKVREKVKRGLSKVGDRVGGKGFNRPALSSQSEPGIIVEGEFRGGDIKASVGQDDPRPGDSQSVSHRSAVETRHDPGSDNNDYGGETGQKRLHLHPRVRAESGSSQERRDVDGKRADQVNPPSQSDIGAGTTPAPSVSRGGESEGT